MDYDFKINLEFIKKIGFLNKKPIMKSSSPFILVNQLLLCFCLLIASVQVSAQTISYDSVAEDNARQDTLTFVEDFADAKYALNALQGS